MIQALTHTSITDWLIAGLLIFGALFVFLGSLGLARLPDFYMRLHAPTKASTLGVGAILLGSTLYFSSRGEGLSAHEILIVAFLFITAPVSALMMARAARHIQLSRVKRTHSENES